MTTTEIYKLANEMTEQEVLNIIGGWENSGDTKSINDYNVLVRLGDSKQLACVSVIAEIANRKEDSNMYRIAYES